MLDKAPIFVDPKKRGKHFHTLNMEEVNVLRSSEDAEYIAKEFDRIFLKLQRLISYQTLKNNDIKSKLDEDTNNLIKKFLNYVKWKALPRKIKDEQAAFFQDICRFINFFDWDSYFTKIHNSLPKTTEREYNDKTIWEQFFQLSYWRERWLKWMSEWWSCRHRTLFLYNFFNKLKEAWLDLDIKLFRYKNMDDKIANNFPSMRHSWLVVTFQWEDYFVDHDGIQLWWRGEEPIARKLQPYIDVAKQGVKDDKLADFFENFKHENMKETDKIIFFDNTDDFISHLEKYPGHKRISFYSPRWEWERPDRVDFEFVKNWIWIAINGQWNIFYLKDNNISKGKFPMNIFDKITLKKDEKWSHPISKEDKERFQKMFLLVRDKINTDWLYDNFTSWGKWESKIIDMGWAKSVFIVKWYEEDKYKK